MKQPTYVSCSIPNVIAIVTVVHVRLRMQLGRYVLHLNNPVYLHYIFKKAY